MKLRAVAFDLDGTLYPYRHLAIRAAAFAARNIRLARRFGHVREVVRTVRPIGNFRRVQAELFAEATGMSLADSGAWIERRIYVDWVRSFRSISPYPGIRELLEDLGRMGLARAVLSDFPVAEKLGYLGLSDCFAVALCSEDSGYLKPSPEPFALLCGRLGLSPQEILFVGDSYDYDIIGAHAYGLHTAHLSGRRDAKSVADLLFTSYRSLRELLPELASPRGFSAGRGKRSLEPRN